MSGETILTTKGGRVPLSRHVRRHPGPACRGVTAMPMPCEDRLSIPPRSRRARRRRSGAGRHPRDVFVAIRDAVAPAAAWPALRDNRASIAMALAARDRRGQHRNPRRLESRQRASPISLAGVESEDDDRLVARGGADRGSAPRAASTPLPAPPVVAMFTQTASTPGSSSTAAPPSSHFVWHCAAAK